MQEIAEIQDQQIKLIEDFVNHPLKQLNLIKKIVQKENLIINSCNHYFHKSCVVEKAIQISPLIDQQELKQFRCNFGGCQRVFEYNIIRQLIPIKEPIDPIYPIPNRPFTYQFHCPICEENKDREKDCITLDCDHFFCQYCLACYILQSQAKAKIVCPTCQDLPVQERFPNDPEHNKEDIEIPSNYIQNCLTPEQYDSFNRIKIQQQSLKEKQNLFQCHGFLKKIKGKFLPKDIVIEQETILKIQDGQLNNLGFELKNCEMFYEIDENNHTQFYKCEVCQFEQCLKCHEKKHANQTCIDFRKQKLQNTIGDQFLQELLKQNPELYKQCPKCNELVEKISGCNRVTCINNVCNAEICWICLKFYDTKDECYDHLTKCHKDQFY